MRTDPFQNFITWFSWNHKYVIKLSRGICFDMFKMGWMLYFLMLCVILCIKVYIQMSNYLEKISGRKKITELNHMEPGYQGNLHMPLMSEKPFTVDLIKVIFYLVFLSPIISSGNSSDDARALLQTGWLCLL